MDWSLLNAGAGDTILTILGVFQVVALFACFVIAFAGGSSDDNVKWEEQS